MTYIMAVVPFSSSKHIIITIMFPYEYDAAFIDILFYLSHGGHFDKLPVDRTAVNRHL